MKAGGWVKLSVKGRADPDEDELNYRWWRYHEADKYEGSFAIQNAEKHEASFNVPVDANKGDTIHVICEVTDNGTPPLTRYQRVVVTVK